MTISDNLPPSSNSLLTLDRVTYQIQGQTILKDASLAIEPGEFISFFGPNGGGKTTLLNLIMGFLSPSSGEIRLLGKPPQKTRTAIGYLPQNFRPDPLFPICVYDVVSLGNPNAKEALLQVGMSKFSGASFGSLSGGEASRVLLARALAGNPKILLLDEPIASIDPANKEIIYNLLRSLRGKITILMVTHDLDGALALSDRLYCVNKTIEEHSKASLCHHFAQGLYHEGGA